MDTEQLCLIQLVRNLMNIDSKTIYSHGIIHLDLFDTVMFKKTQSRKMAESKRMNYFTIERL